MEDKKLLCKQDFEAAKSKGMANLSNDTHVVIFTAVILFQIVMMATSDRELPLQHVKWKY